MDDKQKFGRRSTDMESETLTLLLSRIDATRSDTLQLRNEMVSMMATMEGRLRADIMENRKISEGYHDTFGKVFDRITATEKILAEKSQVCALNQVRMDEMGKECDDCRAAVSEQLNAQGAILTKQGELLTKLSSKMGLLWAGLGVTGSTAAYFIGMAIYSHFAGH